MREDNPLYTMPNVIVTPHMGWRGLETRQRLYSWCPQISKRMEELLSTGLSECLHGVVLLG